MARSNGTFTVSLLDLAAGDDRVYALHHTHGEREGKVIDYDNVNVFHISGGVVTEVREFPQTPASPTHSGPSQNHRSRRWVVTRGPQSGLPATRLCRGFTSAPAGRRSHATGLGPARRPGIPQVLHQVMPQMPIRRAQLRPRHSPRACGTIHRARCLYARSNRVPSPSAPDQ